MDRLRWCDKVKQRDGMKCVACGGTDRLQAHHIKPAFLYPECRSDVDNGITLCKACHQEYHGGNFAGDKLIPVNGNDPDPEGRMRLYMNNRAKKKEERLMVYVVWGTSKENGGMVFEAAKKAGQDPRNYIGEAVSMRLKADGFENDRSLFIKEWLEKRKEE